ncbi:MAG: hypothetical protein GX455_07105 [Phycisphaerae bacterium]|nr:hypothetical protein [Phycisphaerae bacterium]
MNWLQVIYQYTMGGIFFVVTLSLCLYFRAADLKNRSDKKAVIYLILGFFGYLIFHVVWIVLASPDR